MLKGKPCIPSIWPQWIICGLSNLTLGGRRPQQSRLSEMNGGCWVNPHHRRTAAGAGASRAPGLHVSSQRGPSGKCLFSLLNLSNTNTVNFIRGGRSRWIIYEPPVSIPKPPWCLPACVFAHTSSRVLVNQHIVKCLCMQCGGGTPPHYIGTHIYLSLLY